MAPEVPGGALAPERLDRPSGDPLFSRLFPPLATGVHWGLDRTLSALADLDDPHRAYPVLHVGGTNGKGSVASTLSAALSANGARVACYTSPHLCSFRERFTIRGRALSEATLVTRADEIRDTVVRHGLTFFEAVTVLGFHAFAEAGAEVAVVEVGLGGRLDATNVVHPVVSAVTNVAMDHSDYLGDTLPRIAREKAGIIKPGVPFLTAETDPDLLTIFRAVAEENGAPMREVAAFAPDEIEVAADHTQVRLDTGTWGTLTVRTPLVGAHQAANTALAVAMLEALPDSLRPSRAALLEGVGGVRHPGRDQIEVIDGRTWIFDVAHNTAGVTTLVDTLDRVGLPHPLVALVGVLGDKDWRTMLPPLLARCEFAVLTQPPSAPPERRWDPAEAADAVLHVAPLRVERNFPAALRLAREAAGNGTVVVTGSCHTVGSALAALDRAPLR